MNVSRGKLISVAVGTFCMMLCSGIVLNSTTYFTLSVTEYLNCTTTAFSVYFTIVTACTALVSPITGSITRKIGARKSMLIAFAGGSIGFLILSRLQSLWMVYLGALCVGIAQTFIVVPTVGVINAWFDESKSSTVTGISMSATGFGGLLMGIIMPYSVAHFQWRTGYLICLALWMAASLTACALAGGTPPGAEERAKAAADADGKKRRGQGAGDLLKRPSFYVVLFTALCASGATMITQHMSVHLTNHGMGLAMISFVIGGMSLALSLFKIAEGALCSKIPEKIFIPFVYLAGAVGYLALNGRSTPVLLLGIVSYGCGAASVTVLYPYILRRLYGSDAATAVWGLVWSMFMVGQAIWTPFYGSVFDSTGEYSIGLYTAAAIQVFSAVFISLQLSDRRRAEEPAVQKA